MRAPAVWEREARRSSARRPATRSARRRRTRAWFAALPCALAIGFAIAVGDTANAVPPTALLDAHGPIPESQFGAALRGAGVLSGATTRRMLHFTFDDGPDAKLTQRLFDELDRAGFKATFFFSTSRFVPEQRRNAHAPKVALEAARRGHQLGVHGFEHVRMSRLRPPELQAQVAQSEAMFARVFGTRTFLYRPPFGSRNTALDQMLAERGYATVMWNIGMADWVERTPELVRLTFWRAIERNEKERGERGGIVLLHDTHEWSVAAFALIADSIAARNCELLAAGEELYDVVDSMAPWVSPPSDRAYAERQAKLRTEAERRCSEARGTARTGTSPAREKSVKSPAAR